MSAPTAQDYLNRIRLREVASALIALSTENEPLDSPIRNGGILSIMVLPSNSETTTSLSTRNVGNPGPKISNYAHHAHEKLRRLYTRRGTGGRDVAASHSADNVTTFGGAIFFRADVVDVYISLSGAPPKVDEAIAYVIGEKLGLPAPQGYENSLLERARELLIYVIQLDVDI